MRCEFELTMPIRWLSKLGGVVFNSVVTSSLEICLILPDFEILIRGWSGLGTSLGSTYSSSKNCSLYIEYVGNFVFIVNQITFL